MGVEQERKLQLPELGVGPTLPAHPTLSPPLPSTLYLTLPKMTVIIRVISPKQGPHISQLKGRKP